MSSAPSKSSSRKRETVKWIIGIAIFLTLYLTGWHRPLISSLQSLVLATGLIQPDIEHETSNSERLSELSLVNESGEVISLQSLGAPVYFINIWATWCPPCRAEMPEIEKLYKDLDEKGVEFIMISVDEDFEKAISFRKKSGYSFPIYRLYQNLPKALAGRSIPRSYVVDSKGRIRMQHSGMASYNTERFRNYLLGFKP